MPLAQIIWSQLTQIFTNNITRRICLNLDMTLQINMIKYYSFNKLLSQFGKGAFCIGSNDCSWLAEVFSFRSLCFFGMDPLFGFSRFLIFMTFLFWLFFILIFFLDSLIILL